MHLRIHNLFLNAASKLYNVHTTILRELVTGLLGFMKTGFHGLYDLILLFNDTFLYSNKFNFCKIRKPVILKRRCNKIKLIYLTIN